MRRFIAGAVCPRCRAVDRIVVEDVDDGEATRRRRCVSCGYSDTMCAGAVIEPRGRFARPLQAAPQAAPEARPVRVIDGGKRSVHREHDTDDGTDS